MRYVLAFSWIRDNPSTAAAVGIFIAGSLATLVRYALVRHREFVIFTAHMAREEKEVWPELSRQIGRNHEQAMELLSRHGERISALEGKMPNGEIKEIKRMVEAMYERHVKPRGAGLT